MFENVYLLSSINCFNQRSIKGQTLFLNIKINKINTEI